MRVYKSPRRDIDLPSLDVLSLLFDSDWCLAREKTTIHVEAANPSNNITKADARILTKRIGHLLRHRFGIGSSGPGEDAVLTLLHGSPFAPVLFYGLVAAGGIYCGASTESTIAELLRQIDDSKASMIICTPDCEKLVVEAATQSGIPSSRILLVDSSTSPLYWSLTTVSDRQNILKDHHQQLEWPRITDLKVLQNTTICLLYSSGTTGLPKGVRVSHSALVANIILTMDPARRFKANEARDGRTFAFNTIAHLPMSNIAGIGLYASAPFYMGGTTYWMEKYDFDSFLAYHRKYRPEYQFTVPPVWLRIAKSDKVTDEFDNLQVGVAGSAPMGAEIVAEVLPKLGKGKAHFAQTWGTTEAGGVMTAQDWVKYREEGAWTVGELCPNVTLRVVDDEDNDVPEGEPGEFLIGGPILTQGYHNRDEANRESFVNGFFRTGDIGTYKDGHVMIHDRKKELIKYKGSQVAPAELEALLNSSPKVADAAVIGVWDQEQHTEVPRAYVVKQKGASVGAQEIMDFVKDKAANHKRLRGGVIFVDEIPKSASGKILRKELRARVKAEEHSGKAKL
jgi:4-coumarate--CoA ligase